MTWTPLSDRIADLPLILAGPILRRTEADQVTVWIALQAGKRVRLEILDASGTALPFSGERDTVMLGDRVHIVAVTARPDPGHETSVLQAGSLYLYDLVFDGTERLRDDGVFAEQYATSLGLGYPPHDLPAFSLPPSDPNDLRVVHGSCRRPHGEDRDALEALDRLLEIHAADPDRRPHHLLLTGDQVYSDNVAEALLYEITHANDALFGGWHETVAGAGVTADLLLPGTRHETLRDHLGRPEVEEFFKKSHLLTLTEYLTMYLYAWSDVLWPAEWPDFDTVRTSPDPEVVPDAKPTYGSWTLWLLPPSREAAFDWDVQMLDLFRETLPRVRRGLANVPTYMMFDDHDVTDDWGISYEWTDRVLSSAYGEQHLRNAISAFAICQGWGNKPDEFEIGSQGEDLLQGVGEWIGTQGASATALATIAAAVGPPPIEDRGAGWTAGPTTGMRWRLDLAGGMRWDFVVEYPYHRIVGLDCRTRIGYPDQAEGFAALIDPADFARQIPDSTVPVTFLVSGAPIFGYLLHLHAQAAMATLTSAGGGDAEEWIFNQSAMQGLIDRLATTGPQGTTTTGAPGRRQRVIALAGDVHYGYMLRMQYWADRPLSQAGPFAADLLMVQAVCSSLRNQRANMVTLHRVGFPGWGTQWLEALDPFETAEIVCMGWNNDSGSELTVGRRATDFRRFDGTRPDEELRIKGEDAVYFYDETHRNPVTELSVNPDWRFRADFLFDDRSERIQPPLPDLSAGTDPTQSPEQNGEAELIAAREAHLRRTHTDGIAIVGRNQLGEITLRWENGEPAELIHEFWWRAADAVEGAPAEPINPVTLIKAPLDFDSVASPQPVAAT